MAPQTKREAEQSDEVCKRLKDDNKEKNDSKSVSKEVEITAKNDNNNIKSVVETSNGDAVKSETGDGVQANGEMKNKKGDVDSASSSEAKSQTNGEEENDKKVGGEKAPAEVDSTTKEEVEKAEEEEVNEGVLVIFGGANWDMTGRKELPKNAKKPVDVVPGAKNLWGPHKVVLDGGKPLRVKGVFSGSNACHSVIVTDEGLTMTFGRNDKGQLGLGDTATRVTPVVVEGLRDMNVIAAACGRSHTLFLTDEGVVYSCGDNKMGQCGTNQQSVHQITTPARVAYGGAKIIKMSCGAEFSMILDDEGRLFSFGHPEHGQLGHNSEGKYFTTGNKYAFHCEYQPRRIVTWIEKSRDGHVSPVDDVHIIDVACGTNHTLAVDKRNRCFSWGFAGYHRLGHSETRNELVPRSLKLFDAPASSGRGCKRVYAGAQHSMALDGNGLLYFWGQNKSSGEATMYPKTVQDLCGWRISHVACANRSIVVVAEDSLISWGSSPTYGELGYGEGKAKSSTTPQEVRTLDGIRIADITCGYGHTLVIARDKTEAERKAIEEKLESWP